MDCTICTAKYRGKQASPPEEEVLEAHGILRKIGPEIRRLPVAPELPHLRAGSDDLEAVLGMPGDDPEMHSDTRVVVHEKASWTCTEPIP